MDQNKLRLKGAITDFLKSKKDDITFMRLFYAFFSVTRQGDGLTWDEVSEITKNALTEK